MVPFRSSDPDPRGGCQHVGLNSVELHQVMNCLLSAFPHTAVNRLALKIHNRHVCVGIYFSTYFSSGLSSPSSSDLMLFMEGHCQHLLGTSSHILPVLVVYRLTSSSQQYQEIGLMWYLPWYLLLPRSSGSKKTDNSDSDYNQTLLCCKLLSFIGILKITGTGYWTVWTLDKTLWFVAIKSGFKCSPFILLIYLG